MLTLFCVRLLHSSKKKMCNRKNKTIHHKPGPLTVLALLFCFQSLVGYAQTESDIQYIESNKDLTDITSLSDEDYAELMLPPLSVLLDAALTSPNVQTARAKKLEEEGRMNLVKKEWLNNIRINGNYSYGSMGTMVEQSATGISSYYQFTGQIQSLFNVGASVSIPVDLFLTRNTKIRNQEAIIDQANGNLLLFIEERKLLITETYAAALRNIRALKILTEAMMIANADARVKEANFLNGTIEISALYDSRRYQSEIVTRYEDTKGDLNRSILRLEILTNIKISK